MSIFTKKLKEVRAARLNKVAEDEVIDETLQAYINKMAEWGVTIDAQNAKPKTKEEAWTSIILLTSSPAGKGWVESTLMAIDNKQEAINTLLDKIREINNEFDGFGTYFSKVSDTKLKQYEFSILPSVRYRGMTGGQQIATWLYGSMQTFYGDAVIGGLEDEELEKMAKQLTAEFAIKVRQMLASLKK